MRRFFVHAAQFIGAKVWRGPLYAKFFSKLCKIFIVFKFLALQTFLACRLNYLTSFAVNNHRGGGDRAEGCLRSRHIPAGNGVAT